MSKIKTDNHMISILLWNKNTIEMDIDDKTIMFTKEQLIELTKNLVEVIGQAE